MNADKIARDLERIIECSSVGAIDKHYGESVIEALSAFNAIRELLKIQWESEHYPGVDFRKKINEILSEFHITDEEVLDIISEYTKKHIYNCTDCILDLTDACPRVAGRATDDSICNYFMEKKE